jgi:hypothetical protein
MLLMLPSENPNPFGIYCIGHPQVCKAGAFVAAFAIAQCQVYFFSEPVKNYG